MGPRSKGVENGTRPLRLLVEQLLAEQRALTAVEQFAQRPGPGEAAGDHYRALLPVSRPTPGQQYAFEVDLDRCSGCKACVAACHALNGLDDAETWREVGTLVSEDWRRPFRQTVTTSCHHCVEPACLEGCPVLAYDKDPTTGIVRHLDDQCIGCQYCILMCPYDVPKYSPKRGIVRKCDLCAQRLSVGEAPACVQGCPHEAIRITLVEPEVLRREYRPGPSTAATPRFLPAAPDPALTLPTTRFVSARPLAGDLIPENAAEVRLQPAHGPLVGMLVLSQTGVGSFLLLPVSSGEARAWLALLGGATTVAGLAIGVLHLGRPRRAWRSFLGLRRSWLSREIVAFGGFLLLVLAGTLAGAWRSDAAPAVAHAWSAAVAVAGLSGVLCSGLLYHATRRVLWQGAHAVGRFLGTTLKLGLAASWAVTALFQAVPPVLPLALVLVALVKLAAEHHLLRHAASARADEVWPKDGDFDAWSLAQSARLMLGPLGLLTRMRMACGWIGGVLLPLLALMQPGSAALLALLALLYCLGGELAERYVFFRAVVPPRMPVPLQP